MLVGMLVVLPRIVTYTRCAVMIRCTTHTAPALHTPEYAIITTAASTETQRCYSSRASCSIYYEVCLLAMYRVAVSNAINSECCCRSHGIELSRFKKNVLVRVLNFSTRTLTARAEGTQDPVAGTRNQLSTFLGSSTLPTLSIFAASCLLPGRKTTAVSPPPAEVGRPRVYDDARVVG